MTRWILRFEDIQQNSGVKDAFYLVTDLACVPQQQEICCITGECHFLITFIVNHRSTGKTVI
ncbi:hypothetical protein [Nostoc sp. LPT]|uniref:hypothetical protein n=1 Tax=Nostoc sp. LPT TaxID=2815387 RepID=UPI001DA8F0ED|nr:hypothetical protein [Nostoc sp. LPT]MBN4004973.1 hypothetical protein [Nostoc sp. LPT]